MLCTMVSILQPDWDGFHPKGCVIPAVMSGLSWCSSCWHDSYRLANCGPVWTLSQQGVQFFSHLRYLANAGVGRFDKIGQGRLLLALDWSGNSCHHERIYKEDCGHNLEDANITKGGTESRSNIWTDVLYMNLVHRILTIERDGVSRHAVWGCVAICCEPTLDSFISLDESCLYLLIFATTPRYLELLHEFPRRAYGIADLIVSLHLFKTPPSLEAYLDSNISPALFLVGLTLL